MPTTPVLSPKHRQYLRTHGAPTRRTTNPNRAAAHIQQLRHAGLTDQQIRAAARIGHSTLDTAANRRARISVRTEQRILAVPVPTGPQRVVSAAMVPPHGTRRRLQALIHAGWPAARLGAELGIHPNQLYRLLHATHDAVAVRTEAAVAQGFRRLWDQQPEERGVKPISARRARLLAERHQWAPALAWDDIDAADAVPDLGREVSRVQAVVEDTAELVAEGLSREGIAVRLGIGWDAVRQAHRRAGRPAPVVWE
jgi:hypothetical protein